MTLNQKQTDRQMRVTVLFGHGLFYVGLIAIVMRTVIPWLAMFQTPAVRQFHVMVILIVLIANAILPPLIAYFVGGRATFAKNKLEQHYNGVLFGIAAYWLDQLFNYFAIFPQSGNFLIINLWSGLPTIVIMILVGIGYAQTSQHQSSLLDYLPFQGVVLGGIVGFIFYGLSGNYLLLTITSLIIQIVMIAVSYGVLLRSRNSRKATLIGALIAMSIGSIAASFSPQLLGHLNPSLGYNIIVMQLIGVAVWAGYLWLFTYSQGAAS